MATATTANPMEVPVVSERIEPKRVVAFVIMVFGMFMAILDIQVVSASLSDIQAGLSASSTRRRPHHRDRAGRQCAGEEGRGRPAHR